jgi:hypothetical protein
VKENRIGDGILLTFESCTAFSNIPAGTPVAIGTGLATGHSIYTLGNAVAGMGETGANVGGAHFIGITDKDYSAGESPVSVWTEGVFRMYTSSSTVKANLQIGFPVWQLSGTRVVLGVPPATHTGDVPIGTLVGICGASGNTTGRYVEVLIRPGAYRWTIYGSGILAASSATSPEGLCWPSQVATA